MHIEELPGNQAGGHPDVLTHYALGDRRTQDGPGGCDCSDAKDLFFNEPPGVIGNPHATPLCSEAELASSTCPSDSQIGLVDLEHFVVPLYNVEPPPGDPGLAAFVVPAAHIYIYEIISPRTENDYGLKFSIYGIGFHLLPLTEFNQLMWGVPAAHSHDHMRFPRGGGNACLILNGESIDEAILRTELDGSHSLEGCEFNVPYNGTVRSNSPEEPFISNPTSCGVPLKSEFEVISYDDGISRAEDPWPATTGCDGLSFNPSLFAQPTTTAADSPSGVELDLKVPQQVSPTVPSPSEIRSTTVTLPEGFTINPGAADGKDACTDEEARFGTEEESRCPEFSKVGTLSILSAALPSALPGYVYLGQPLQGEKYRLFLVANGFGVHLKLSGTVAPNPATGQLTVSFSNLPQTSFSEFNMHFFGSDRGLLATPTKCGEYPVLSTFTPWDSLLSTQTSVQYFKVTSGPNGGACPVLRRPFAPTFRASASKRIPAGFSPFTVEINRSDGDQNLKQVTVTTPPGLFASLASIPYCSDASLMQAEFTYSGLAEQTAPACPVASLVGKSMVGAGAGDHPVYLPGSVYLTGPYRGAPLSLAVITPAVSGPYDLGNVVVRIALRINEETAQISAVSDALPQIIEGIPLRLRSIQVNLNRERFVVNPTNCDAFSVGAEISGSEGAVEQTSTGFRLADCGTLPFAPKLSIALIGSPERSKSPELEASLSAKGGEESNIARARVSLPPSELLDNAHIAATCSRPQLALNQCPSASQYGAATAVTPLLEKPLGGPVYLVTGFGTKLPALVADLDGQIQIVLRGTVGTDSFGGIQNSFEAVPDAPISKFTLRLYGGKKGLLQNSGDVCRGSRYARASLAAQNGRSEKLRIPLSASCDKRVQSNGTNSSLPLHSRRDGGRWR